MASRSLAAFSNSNLDGRPKSGAMKNSSAYNGVYLSTNSLAQWAVIGDGSNDEAAIRLSAEGNLLLCLQHVDRATFRRGTLLMACLC